MTHAERTMYEFKRMWSSNPDYSKYKGDTLKAQNMLNAWRSKVFGGDVIKPVGVKGKSKRTKKNPLEEDLKKFNIMPMYGGGYYKLENVQQSEHDPEWFYDIYLLTD